MPHSRFLHFILDLYVLINISWVFLFPQFVYEQTEVVGVAIQGTINVLKSCLKSKTVKRVVFTTSACAMAPLNEEGKLNNNPCSVESFWSPVNHFRANKEQFPIWVLSHWIQSSYTISQFGCCRYFFIGCHYNISSIARIKLDLITTISNLGIA